MRYRTPILIAIGVLALAGIFVFSVWPAIVARLIAAHRQAVTAELAGWGQEYSTLRDANEAGRALDMLEYIKHYYVVAPGNGSDPETEARLEKQRRDTMKRISSALDRCIDKHEGNAEVWRQRKSTALIGAFLEAENGEP